MKLHEISNNGSLTPAQIKWLDTVINGTYEVVDGKINVEGVVNVNVGMSSDILTLPVQFGKVTGYFSCSFTKITSLKGCPSKVDGNFYCVTTQITSLEDSPSEVGGSFSCGDTEINSLIGIADNITQINGEFYADWHKIKSGGLGLILIPGLKGLSTSYGNLTKPFKIIDKYIGKPDLIFDCQQELIEAGFEEYAQL